MITLNVDDYCRECEGFEPEARKFREKNHNVTEISCARRSWCKNAIKLYERAQKEGKNNE